VRVWDLPTRLFHWVLVLAVVGLVVTGKVGGNALVWHMRLGLLVAALLGFRLVWGLVGGHWSRFASFVRGPGTVLRYLRQGGAPGDVGHNPLGALSVLAMLGLLLAQVATGLVADDEIATTGPLNRFVASATGLAATAWHKGYGQWVVLALVLLHVGAITYYRVAQGRNLVAPMLSGDAPAPAGTPASADTPRTRLLALVVMAVLAAAAVAVARL
jgi:cytochrome b